MICINGDDPLENAKNRKRKLISISKCKIENFHVYLYHLRNGQPSDSLEPTDIVLLINSRLNSSLVSYFRSMFLISYFRRGML